MLDIMLAALRLKHWEVTDEHLKNYEDAANEANKLCKKLNLSYTPSFHYLHKEAGHLLRLHGGFGELTEDHLEQSHQTMDRIHQQLGHLGFGAKWAMALSRLSKISSNPKIRALVNSVNKERKRKFKGISKGQAKRADTKKVKLERRAESLTVEKAIPK